MFTCLSICKCSLTCRVNLQNVHFVCHVNIYRDLKPANILVNNKGFCKIADLGMAGFNNENNTFQGTMNYMSPERLKGAVHSFDSDLWSFGILVAECALGKFPREAPSSTIYDLLEEEKTVSLLPNNLSESLKHFVSQCCQCNPADRPTIDALLAHEFLRQVDRDNLQAPVAKWLKDTFIKAKKEQRERKAKATK